MSMNLKIRQQLPTDVTTFITVQYFQQVWQCCRNYVLLFVCLSVIFVDLNCAKTDGHIDVNF